MNRTDWNYGTVNTSPVTRLTGLLLIVLAMFATVPVQAYFLNPATGFHGTGSSPDWDLDIDFSGNTMSLKTADGTVSYHYTRLGPTLRRAEKTIIYRTLIQHHYMNVVVVNRFCQDTTTGKAYTAIVTIRHDGRTYTGCGTEVMPPFED